MNCVCVYVSVNFITINEIWKLKNCLVFKLNFCFQVKYRVHHFKKHPRKLGGIFKNRTTGQTTENELSICFSERIYLFEYNHD